MDNEYKITEIVARGVNVRFEYQLYGNGFDHTMHIKSTDPEEIKSTISDYIRTESDRLAPQSKDELTQSIQDLVGEVIPVE